MGRLPTTFPETLCFSRKSPLCTNSWRVTRLVQHLTPPAAPGGTLHTWPHWAHRVTGIDSTAEMLETARAKVPSAQFETADLMAIPLPDGAMDFAVCTLALTHCADLGPPIREIARVVRPGGHVVISDVHPLMVLLGVYGGYRRQPNRSKGSSGTTSTWHRTISPCFKTRDSTSSNA